MVVFDLELLKSGYFSDETFQEANDLYTRNGVSLLNSEVEMMTDTYKVDGEVSDGDITHKVHLEFAKSRNKEYHILVGERSCTCTDYTNSKSNCPHMATFLMYLNNYSLKEIEEGILESDTSSDDVSYFEDIFMKDYENTYDNQQMVMVEIILEQRVNEIYCFLKVGPRYKKRYVVRDIMQFAQMFKTQEKHVYGKLFEFTHSLNNIDKSQQGIIKALIDIIDSREEPLKDPKFIKLSHGELELLVRLLEGRYVTIMRNNGVYTQYQVVKEDIPFELMISKIDDGYEVHLDQTSDICWFSNFGMYSITENRVSYNSILDHKIFDFLRATYAKHLKVMDADFFSFYDNVLVEVGKYIKIKSDFSIKQLYNDIYLPEVFVDTTGNNIKIDVILKNGQNKVDYDFINELSIPYSKSRMLKLNKHLLSYGNVVDGSIIVSDEKLVYDFCVNGVKTLSEFSEAIYSTDRFKNIKIVDRQSVNVGVKISNNLLNVNIKLDNVDEEEILKILNAYHQKSDFYRLANGDFIELNSDFVRELNDVVESLDIDDEGFSQDGFNLNLHHGLYLDYIDNVSDYISLTRDSSYDEFLDKVDNIEALDVSVPDNLRAELKPYQVEGYKFLKMMQHLNFGAILADDMGLGKTIQVITLILSHKNEKPSLIVCPSSLILNWANEFKKFAPSMNIITINEDGHTRSMQFKEGVSDQIIITSYELLKRDQEHYKNLEFQYFVLDESHYIKNNKTMNFKTVKDINAEFNIALTGTPIENSLAELWSLFDFVAPGYLGNYNSFSKKYEIPILKEDDFERLNQLKSLVKPFILRRLKSEVLDDLPEKHEKFAYVDMPKHQDEIYQANLVTIKKDIENLTDSTFNSNKFMVLSMLTRLRQLACDPRLVYEDYTYESAKIEKAVDIIKTSILNGNKVLLFSQFTSMLEILEQRLNDEGISYFVLKGSTKKEDRQAMADSFNVDDTRVFLISLKAGGTGLNLIGANTVIHFDPWWNMSAQNQATDRVYRIGQTSDVTVHKLIARDTIEQKIIELQEKKSRLAEDMLSESQEAITKMSKQDLLELFT